MKLPLRRSVPLVVLACVFVASAVAVPSGLAVAARSAELSAQDDVEATLSAHLDVFEEALARRDLGAAHSAIASLMGDRVVRRALIVTADATIHCGDRLEDAGGRIPALAGLDGLQGVIAAAVDGARTRPRAWLSGHLAEQRVVGAVTIGPPGPDAPVLVVVADMGPELFKVRHDSVATLGVFLTFVFLTSVAAGLAFHRLVGRRAAALLAASERVAAGDLETRTGVSGEDEIGVIGAAFDAMVTRLAERSDEIRRSEASYRQLFEHAVEPIFVATATSRILEVNGAAVTLLEEPPESFKGRRLSEILVGGSTGDEPPASPVAKRELLLRDGRRIPCEVSWRGLPDGRLLVLARDLRAEQDAEALRQALVVNERLAALGTLAASVGHEINNPLTYLLANLRTSVEIIHDAALPTDTRGELDELLGDAVDGAERVRRIVADLNVFARPAAADVRLAPVDLEQVVARAVSLSRPALSERCRVVVAPMGPLVVLGDERRLAQIVVNLLTNASQAMPPGRPRDDNVVTISARRDGERVALDVADNGIGMSEEVRARIFEPFFTTRVGHGAGLGLSISRELAVSVSGDISVTSRVGNGATFTVKLRAASALSPTAATPAPSSPHGVPSAASTSSPATTLLVVDDDVRVAQAIGRELHSHFAVKIASSVAEAVAVVAAGHIDCVLCDLAMPDGGARTLLAELPPALRARVVIVTGGAQSAEMSEFLERAGRPVIGKPIERERLFACVASVLQPAAIVPVADGQRPTRRYD